MKTIQFLIKWTGLHSILFLLCQLFPLSFLLFLLSPLMICFFQCALSLGIFFWLIPFRLSMPDLNFENFYRFHRRLELRIKRIFNAQSLELFLTVQFRLLAQHHPVFGSHGHHHLVKAVDWRILFPRDSCVWLIPRQDWFCLLCCFLLFCICQRRLFFFFHRLCHYFKSRIDAFYQRTCFLP